MHELKSEEPKETNRNKYDNSKAPTLEMDVVGNERRPTAQKLHRCTKQPCVPRS